MALKYGQIFIVVYVSVAYKYNVLANYHEGPQIDSEFETIIQANDNHTVLCQGHKPLKWTKPEVEDYQKFWTTFITQTEQPTNSNFQYASRLNIVNMSYPYIGFYHCHYDGADVEDISESASIYLYVNDSVHLSLFKPDSILPIVVTQYSEAIIPCKPTSPDVQVELQTITQDTIEDIDYDPKTGFSFFVSDLSQQDIYVCVFTRDLETSNILITLTIETSLPVSHLAKPYLRDLSEHHTVVGDPLVLECFIKSKNSVNFHWTTPDGEIYVSASNTPIGRISQSKQDRRGDKIFANLTVYNTTLEDKGTYTCNVTDNQGHNNFAALDVKIFDVNEYYLNLEEPNNVYSITASAGDTSVQWSVDVRGHPRPKVSWLNNRNDTISMANGSKYEANFNQHTGTALLKIKNIAITDFGNYTLLAENNKTETMIKLFLNVTDKPTVSLMTDQFYLVNTLVTIKCYAYAYPEPEFQWEYKECQSDLCQFEPVNGTILKSEGFEFISEITLNTSNSGYVKCKARNYKGEHEIIRGFYITDIEHGFNLFDLDSTALVNEPENTATIALGQTLTVTCGASRYNYSNITWFLNDRKVTPDDRYTIERSVTSFSDRVKLEIRKANFSNSGRYSCRVTNQYGDYLYKNISFFVSSPQKPIIYTNMKEQIEINMHEELKMFCRVSGIPKPTLTWYKNGALFLPSEPGRIRVSENNENITIFRVNENDEAVFKCVARNLLGEAVKQQSVKIKNKPQSQTWLLLLVFLLSSLCLAALVLILIKFRKEKKLQRELKKLGLANFEKGAIENINPELGVDDQAELLPYDQKWEFPIENLKLGKQLGSGAFGVVMKGEAKNIVEGENVTTVAVKMVKKNTDHTYLRALASELKIMVHLRKHLNVVNLLGACTKNMVKRELLVIVEYCRFGNLQNYLLRHRENYVDQVDQKTGKIDYYIGQEFFDRSYSVSSDRSNTQSPSLKYAALTFSNSGTQPILPPANNMGDYRANANTDASVATEMTTITQGEDGVILSNNSVQPEWRSNYKGDYKGYVKPICTSDLLAWAFQVARGMEYLASRKVLHGDLAARNILLADNNIVKICDFGLAKNMYKNDNYKKRGDGPLPVKWMAIESIRDRIFSTQSDVWSYGIVLWEFFSLAKTPYPGMEADERLYKKLVEGYRMEAPQYAPKEIYKMMTDCWAAKPLARPSFTKLAQTIGNLLEESLRKHYIDLNDPYLVMNTQQLQEGQDDYLAMLCPPTFEALSSPHYVNEDVGQESLEDSGYLSMKPSTIFSPRADEVQVFDFNTNKRRDLSPEDGNRHELLPMLQSTSDSDAETPVQSPTTPNSFSNPSYHIPPKIIEETTGDVDTDSGIVKSADNYVNMPGNKSSMKEKNNATNPFMSNVKGGVHYVNGNTKDWESVRV